MRIHRQAGRMTRRAAGALAAAVSLAASTGAILHPAAAHVRKVTTGPARSLGEPAAAQDSAASAVTATSFTAAGALAEVWTRLAGTTTWLRAGPVRPTGFGTSYDPAAAAAPGGPLLVVAGTAPPGEQCIAHGSVAIASVGADGRLGAARLVSDQRGTGSFDDRPIVAVGPHGLAWVAWSQGPNADSCQDVGRGDRIEIAVSHDGGRTFGTPIAMPADGGQSAFGVRLAPLSGGRVAVSWTETTGTGHLGILVSVLGAGGRPRPPALAMTGPALPLVLPGASFYDFPAGDIAALPGGKLVIAAPFWLSGRGVIKLAVGPPGGPWQQTSLRPPAGADLLLPALGLLSPGSVRLLCAVHTRVGDRLGYRWADVTETGHGPNVGSVGLTALTVAPAGPGFFEVGEELALARTPGGLLTAIVVAGQHGAALETAMFSIPPAATAAPGRASAPASTSVSGRAAPAARPAVSANGRAPGFTAMAGWVAAAAAGGAAIAGALLLRRHRRSDAGLRRS